MIVEQDKQKKEKLLEALVPAQEEIRKAIPSTYAFASSPDRYLKIALEAATKNPLLLECAPASIAKALIEAASLGLDPSGGTLGHAYLVPYRAKNGAFFAQLIVGYRGLLELARRSEKFLSVETRIVYECDSFSLEYRPEGAVFSHVPAIQKDRGAIVAVYCVARFRDGAQFFEIMTADEIELIRSRSKAIRGPWETDYGEMARKTVLRRAAKYWPLTAEFVRALALEDSAEDGVPPSGIFNASFSEPKPCPEEPTKFEQKNLDPKFEQATAQQKKIFVSRPKNTFKKEHPKKEEELTRDELESFLNDLEREEE